MEVSKLASTKSAGKEIELDYYAGGFYWYDRSFQELQGRQQEKEVGYVHVYKQYKYVCTMKGQFQCYIYMQLVFNMVVAISAGDKTETSSGPDYKFLMGYANGKRTPYPPWWTCDIVSKRLTSKQYNLI